MTNNLVPPGLVLILGAFVLPFVQGHLRAAVLLALPLIALGLVWTAPDGNALTVGFIGYQIVPIKADALSRLFATIFLIMAFAGGLFAAYQSRTVELTSAFIYAGSAVGVTMAGDLITVFVFWEIMAIASTLVIWSAGTPDSYKASMRYLMVHLFGGVLLMVGVIAHVNKCTMR
jgi:multicomponent Na+:H+ antiporter subunit D